MPRRDGAPVWMQQHADPIALQRLELTTGSTAGGYDEAWLQRLLHNRPELFPIDQIEPGFGRLASVCRELTVALGAGRSGCLDNLYVTATGGFVIVEAKLWRNPEARRSVVAQAMEYAAALFRLSYQELETAINRARLAGAEGEASLYELASLHGSELEEAAFVDAVGRNLRRGRAIVAIVGDGIREDILPLAELLQSHAGHRFTFALVELAIYGTPAEGVRIVIPSVLAQTAMIERGVVRIEDAGPGLPRVTITEPISKSLGGSPRPRSLSIGEDEFYELLDQREPGLATVLKAFLANADLLGFRPDRQSGMSIKHGAPSGNDLNLGTITKDGYLDTGPSTWWGRTEAGKRYNERLAALIGGFVRDMVRGEQSAVRTASGKTPRLSDFLPKFGDEWLAAMKAYVDEMFSAAERGAIA